MKIFKQLRLPSKKLMALTAGFIFFGGLNLLIANYIATIPGNTIYYLMLSAFTVFQFYGTVEYASNFTNHTVDIDLRSYEEKELDNIQHQRQQLEAARNNLILTAIHDNWSKEEAMDKLELLDLMAERIEQPLLLNKENDIV